MLNKNIKLIGLVFDKGSSYGGQRTFKFIEEQPKAWETEVGFIIVDVEKCTSAANNYNIKSYPTFVFQKLEDRIYWITGDNYQEKLIEYIVSKNNTDIKYKSVFFQTLVLEYKQRLAPGSIKMIQGG